MNFFLLQLLVDCKSAFTALEGKTLLTITIIENIFQRQVKLCTLNTKKRLFLDVIHLNSMIFFTVLEINCRVLLEPNFTFKIDFVVLVAQNDRNLRQYSIGRSLQLVEHVVEELDVLELLDLRAALAQDQLQLADELGLLDGEDDHGVVERGAQPVLDLDDVDLVALLQPLDVVVHRHDLLLVAHHLRPHQVGHRKLDEVHLAAHLGGLHVLPYLDQLPQHEDQHLGQHPGHDLGVEHGVLDDLGLPQRHVLLLPLGREQDLQQVDVEDVHLLPKGLQVVLVHPDFRLDLLLQDLGQLIDFVLKDCLVYVASLGGFVDFESFSTVDLVLSRFEPIL